MKFERQPRSCIVTTTSTLEGYRIQAYLGVITSHVVAGTGFFSDFAAGVSDFFGGRSTTYRRQLESLDAEAISELKTKATRLGANALVGFSLDHDEISGQGKQMFMCTARATAVAVEGSGWEDAAPDAAFVDAQAVADLAERRKILERLNASPSESLSAANWQTISNQRAQEFLPYVYARLAQPALLNEWSTEARDSFLRNAVDFIGIFPVETIRGPICRAVADAKTTGNLLKAIRQLSLVDYDVVEELLVSEDSNAAMAAALLMTAHKAAYARADLSRLAQIRKGLEGRFPRAPIIEEKGIFGRKEVWKCVRCGTSCTPAQTSCVCGADAYGFGVHLPTREELLRVLDFRLSLLEELLDLRSAN